MSARRNRAQQLQKHAAAPDAWRQLNLDYVPSPATVGRINGKDSFGVDGGRIADLMRDYARWGLVPGGGK